MYLRRAELLGFHTSVSAEEGQCARLINALLTHDSILSIWHMTKHRTEARPDQQHNISQLIQWEQHSTVVSRDIWQNSGVKPTHSLLPFVSETLDPIEPTQPAQEGWETLLNVGRLLIFIICLLQQHVCVIKHLVTSNIHILALLPVHPVMTSGSFFVRQCFWISNEWTIRMTIALLFDGVCSKVFAMVFFYFCYILFVSSFLFFG